MSVRKLSDKNRKRTEGAIWGGGRGNTFKKYLKSLRLSRIRLQSVEPILRNYAYNGSLVDLTICTAITREPTSPPEMEMQHVGGYTWTKFHQNRQADLRLAIFFPPLNFQFSNKFPVNTVKTCPKSVFAFGPYKHCDWFRTPGIIIKKHLLGLGVQ